MHTLITTGKIIACPLAAMLIMVLLSACVADQLTNGARLANHQGQSFSHNDFQVLAVNIGGPQYTGVDGVKYQADTLAATGTIGQIDKILGSQDSFIYQSYRAGDLKLQFPVDNGAYDIIFKFAEPEDTVSAGRVFSVFAESKQVIADLDIRRDRDGKSRSALVRSVVDIAVTDGQLDIDFKASVGEPIVSAIVIRKKFQDSRLWQLVWSDEFDYQGAPNPDKWNVEVWPARVVNDEDQAYTDRASNVRVEEGRLIIEAFKENYADANYTSGRIHTQGKGDFLYGRAEIRAKLPAGQGTWPAIWMLSSDPARYSTNCKANISWQDNPSCDAWPNSGEIDIMEHVGYNMNTVHGTVHNRAYYWKNWEQRKGSVLLDSVSDKFYTYSLEWSPTALFFFVDDSHYFTYHNEGEGWQAWPYNHPYHLILNLAIGGMWGRSGGDIDDSIFPQRMEVDYVRVYSAVQTGL